MKSWICIVAALAPLAHTALAQDNVNQSSLVLQDFSQRIAGYLKLHKATSSTIHKLKPTNASEDIQRHEHILAHEIREARRGAAQGAIFTPEIGVEFRRLIGIAMKGHAGTRIQATLKEAEPVWLGKLQVNASYPTHVPLQSSPPSLLLNLPALPPELEYRIVGHALILRDVEANLIVDFVRDAIP